MPPGRWSGPGERRDALDKPERGDRADGVGRPAHGAVADAGLAWRSPRRQRRRDERELTQLDADVERQQRQRHVAVRQADLRQRAAKPRPCSRPKQNAISQGRRAVRLGCPARRPKDLGGHDDDREGDRRLDRRPGHTHDAERRQGERDRVRERERRHREHERPRVAHDQHQRQHEQQVVVAEQDVLDAVTDEGREDGQRTARRRRRSPATVATRARAWSSYRRPATARERARRRSCPADRGTRCAGPPARRRLDDAAFDLGESDSSRTGGLGHVAEPFRQLEPDRQRHPGRHRNPPAGRTVSPRSAGVQVRRARIVRHRVARHHEASRENRRRAHSDPPADSAAGTRRWPPANPPAGGRRCRGSPRTPARLPSGPTPPGPERRSPPCPGCARMNAR